MRRSQQSTLVPTSLNGKVSGISTAMGFGGTLMRVANLFGAVVAVLLMQASLPARAGLIGNGTNTVSAIFFLGAPSVPSPPYTNPPPTEIEGPMGPTNPPPPPSLIPAHFAEGPIDVSTIDVGDTTITITNMAPPTMPFCSATTVPCPDVFTGFAFTFSAVFAIIRARLYPA